MDVLLLANVGNHDLELEDLTLLPESSDSQRWKSPRRRGEEIRDHFDRYAAKLQMPLLGPTIRWLIEHERITAQELQVVLFASDQPQAYTDEAEWLKDTAPIADAIQVLLTRQPFEITKKHIRVVPIDGNPADYSNMLDFYAGKLPDIVRHVTDDPHIYMEVSGGTPAMASMLIVMGVEVFGQRVRTLYVDRGATVPYEVGVAGELFARKTRDTLRNQIDLHAYAVAQQTLDRAGDLITSDDKERRLLAALLGYADRRLAFDFKRTREALQEARPLATGVQQTKIQHWLRELEAPNTAAKLSELVYSARIKLRFGDYADFVQRIFRFQEAAFRYMAEQMGMKYGKSDQYLSESWRTSQPALDKFLQHYRRGRDGKPSQHENIEVNTDRSLNRFSLGAIVDFYAQNEPQWSHWRETAEQLHRLSPVADLRNKGISGHGFDGIGQADLEKAFADTQEALMEHLVTLYEGIFGQPPGDNPYDAINALILDLIPTAS